ncbi:MAG: AI-2E family transporter [Gammaproteobacteria bacterium]|nr:MAG: AI-2E family transporter [Gammaproteobacteria bacterium]
MSESTNRWGWIALFGVLALIYVLSPILSPFIIGALLAYLGDPLADRLESVGLGRTSSVILVFVGFSSLMLMVVLLLVPLLGNQIETFSQNVPKVIEWVRTVGMPTLSRTVGIDLDEISMAQGREWMLSSWEFAGDYLQSAVMKITVSSLALVTAIINLALIPVVAFYLLRDWDLMMARLRALLPRRIENEVVSLVGDCDEMLGAFLKGQLLVMIALGVIYGLGLWFVGLDLALLIGVIAGLASIIPYFGFFVGVSAALVAAFFQFGEWSPMIFVVVVFGIGQLLEGMVLTPLLVGDRIGLHPVAVIFAIMAGAQLFGFVGMLIALPVAAVSMVVIRRARDQYLESTLYLGE